MSDRQEFKLNSARIAVIVVMALGMFAGAYAYSTYVHSPFLEGMCRANCAEEGATATEKRSGYGRSSETSCVCVKDGQESAGYYLVSVGFLDWFLVMVLGVLATGVLLFIGIFLIAKVVVLIPE